MLPRFPFSFHLRVILELFLVIISLTIAIVGVFWLIEYAKEKPFYQYISQCNCKRPFQFPPLNHSKIKLSTCSDEASRYKPLQKVVSFTYFETDPMITTAVFLTGLVKNLEMIKIHYPGFSMRVYTNKSLGENIKDLSTDEFCQVVCSNKELHWCDIRETPSHGNLSKMDPITWHYLPLGDQSVQLFLSRDLDAVISEREVSAVREWINIANDTGKGIQVMRDHGHFHEKPILGGLWGANNEILGWGTTRDLQNRLIWRSEGYPMMALKKRNSKSQQNILENFIFKMRAHQIIAYDSYHCKETWGMKKPVMTRPFPVQRSPIGKDYVGRKLVLENDEASWDTVKPCPEECRPSYGKNWTFC